MEKRKEKIKKLDMETLIRNGLIICTFISIIIVILNFTHLIYRNSYNIMPISDFLVKYINGPLLWIDNILVYILAISYIVIGIKSKKEVLLKVSFSIFSIITTMVVLTLVINVIAEMFGMF